MGKSSLVLRFVSVSSGSSNTVFGWVGRRVDPLADDYRMTSTTIRVRQLGPHS